MQLFRLDASINPDGSASRAIGDIVEARVARRAPRRHGPPPGPGAPSRCPADAWPAAVKAAWTPEEARTERQRESLALARELAAELRSADAVLATVPLYNFGVAQHVKVWIDLVIAGAEAANERLLDGKPVVLSRRPRRRLRPGHAARRLGSLDRLPAADLRRRVGRRADGHRARVHACRRQPGA